MKHMDDPERQRILASLDHSITLQCSATTEGGRQCRVITNDQAWAKHRLTDQPFTDPEWWICRRHAPLCPHCDFATKGLLSPMLHLKPGLLQDGKGNATGRGLTCEHCCCIWDPRLELLEDNEQCPVFGSGPEPGTWEWVWFNELEFWLKASSEYVAGRIREKDQRSRLAEWRNQLKLEKGDSKDTDWL